ncbi:benzoate transporter [Aquimarina litoralis]|nr:benzoate transporter [Aquimarina litoralis]
MITVLEQLDQNIKEKRPEYYLELNAPLSLMDIQTLEKEYKVVIPQDLKIFYQWKNGQNSNCSEVFANNCMFLSLREMLETQSELNAMIGKDFEIENWWNKHWFPVFDNGGGDHICYDTKGTFTGQKGQLLEFWHDDEDRESISPNLLSLCKALNNYYTSNSIDVIDDFINLETFLDL